MRCCGSFLRTIRIDIILFGKNRILQFGVRAPNYIECGDSAKNSKIRRPTNTYADHNRSCPKGSSLRAKGHSRGAFGATLGLRYYLRQVMVGGRPYPEPLKTTRPAEDVQL
jgi:hypothetical protein